MKVKFLLPFILLIILNACGIKLGRNDRERRNLPAATMQDFLYTYTEKNGYREWELKAAQAHTYEKSDDVHLYNLTMTIFSDKNHIKSVLVANKGIVRQDMGNLIAEGEVRIFSSNRSELRTEKVYWDQKRELFYSETNKLVTYLRGQHKVTGYDMVSDSLLENIELENTVGQIDTGDSSSQGSSDKSNDNDITQFEDEFLIPEDQL